MTQDTAASSDHHAPSVSVPLELSVCTLAVALGGCGQAKHPTVCLPQAFFRLERTAEEAAQNFTPPRVVPSPQHISGLGLDADWFPSSQQLMISDGARLISISVSWRNASVSRKQGLAEVVARRYLGPLNYHAVG